jgi:hypothetical protein
MESVTTETREHTEETPAGTTAVTDVVTVETSTDAQPVVEVEDPEGVDEQWLNERFASVERSLTTLSTQVATNQTQNLETINRLMELVQSQQATMAGMAEKLTTLQQPQPLTPPALEVVTVIPAEIPNPVSNTPEDHAEPSNAASGKSKRVRKI